MPGHALEAGIPYFAKPISKEEHHTVPPEDPSSQGKLTKTAAMSTENYLRGNESVSASTLKSESASRLLRQQEILRRLEVRLQKRPRHARQHVWQRTYYFMGRSKQAGSCFETSPRIAQEIATDAQTL